MNWRIFRVALVRFRTVERKKDPLRQNFFKIMFRKFSPPHRSTLLCWNVVKFVWREIGEIVRHISDKKTIFRLPLKLSLLRGSRPKSARDNMDHFRRSYSWTREHRFLPRRVFPWFARSYASLRLIIMHKLLFNEAQQAFNNTHLLCVVIYAKIDPDVTSDVEIASAGNTTWLAESLKQVCLMNILKWE